MNTPLRTLFFASGAFAVPSLRAVASTPDAELLALVTKPDAPAGRGNRLVANPAKTAALELGLPILEAPDVNDETFLESLSSLRPDLAVVVDFGQFLKAALRAIPPLGTINVHPSLLPRWRGASPIQWTLAAGDASTGVSVLYVTKDMDAGDILSQEPADILPDDTASTLAPRLAEQGARQLLGVVSRFRHDPPPPAVPQSPDGVTFANCLRKSDAVVDWTAPAAVIYNRWRGFHPWPGALAALPDGTPLKLHALRPVPLTAPAAPGTVVAASPDGPVVACGQATAVCLLSVQPAGKPVMSGTALLCGRRLRPGDRLPPPVFR